MARLTDFLTDAGLDAVAISSAANRRYYSGFSGSNGWLLITPGERLLVTDRRYDEQARAEAPDYEVRATGKSFLDDLLGFIRAGNWRRIGYETDQLSDRTSRLLRAQVPADWVPLNDFGLAQRALKDEAETDCIRRSVAMADRCLQELIPSLAVGQTEREIRARLEYLMALAGSDSPAFGTIVGTGARSALPHAAPGDTRVKDGDVCVIDFGTTVEGYYSDLTRTVRFGRVRPELERLFRLVEAAQEAAFAVLRPGLSAAAVDQAHRAVFLAEDMDDYALRGLGHGIGLEIHEWPRIVIDGQETLQPGMIFTIEPGLYVPGLGGVRKEDVVRITETGFEKLTTAPAFIQVEV